MAISLKMRVQERLKALGKNPFEAARDGGLGRDFVNDIIIGRKVSVRGANLAKLARALECDQLYLLGAQVKPSDRPSRAAIDEALRDVQENDARAFSTNAAANLDGMVKELDARAGMGGGGLPAEEQHAGQTVDAFKSEAWVFPPGFLREELRAPADRLIVLETSGDSMWPTIAPGERVVVDSGHIMPSPDGLYALRDRFGFIVVKRLQVMRTQGKPRLKIISDNQNHDPEEVEIDEVEIVGRVVGGFKRY